MPCAPTPRAAAAMASVVGGRGNDGNGDAFLGDGPREFQRLMALLAAEVCHRDGWWLGLSEKTVEYMAPPPHRPRRASPRASSRSVLGCWAHGAAK